ncbi:AAA family ATPase [Solirubrobacter deserti]|uniref:AAA family ATPase n=1 Tax=Solirubrobacter deserti TaxID=2282478 RepID=A0ABT4RI64_9ACTN|nr:AAA family ATPase [Solirubrobacter deserti]MDA0138234.1 AAA family ATPase [Solirubrobacter deserti]
MAYRHGLVLGKFLPPHGGHHELVDFAVERCERVTVLVLGSVTEPIPLPLRREWMKERHPAARVVAGWDEIPVDFDDPHVHDLHIALMERLLNEPIDAVFTGEAYGDLLAERWGVEHVRLQRDGHISGTAVRADPAAFWGELTPSVRAYLTRRVVITGAESTGTTTLAQALAARLNTVWVPEVGRAVTEQRGLDHPWSDADFAMIARRQQRDEDHAARVAGPILVCDTDALATCIWQERYRGRSTADVEAIAASRRYHLTVLTADDIPFVQDGYRDGEHIRGWMTQRFRERLRQPWIEVRGTVDERVEAVLTALSSTA